MDIRTKVCLVVAFVINAIISMYVYSLFIPVINILDNAKGALFIMVIYSSIAPFLALGICVVYISGLHLFIGSKNIVAKVVVVNALLALIAFYYSWAIAPKLFLFMAPIEVAQKSSFVIVYSCVAFMVLLHQTNKLKKS